MTYREPAISESFAFEPASMHRDVYGSPVEPNEHLRLEPRLVSTSSLPKIGGLYCAVATGFALIRSPSGCRNRRTDAIIGPDLTLKTVSVRAGSKDMCATVSLTVRRIHVRESDGRLP